jgi:hypothetical protein
MGPLKSKQQRHISLSGCQHLHLTSTHARYLKQKQQGLSLHHGVIASTCANICQWCAMSKSCSLFRTAAAWGGCCIQTEPTKNITNTSHLNLATGMLLQCSCKNAVLKCFAMCSSQCCTHLSIVYSSPAEAYDSSTPLYGSHSLCTNQSLTGFCPNQKNPAWFRWCFWEVITPAPVSVLVYCSVMSMGTLRGRQNVQGSMRHATRRFKRIRALQAKGARQRLSTILSHSRMSFR